MVRQSDLGTHDSKGMTLMFKLVGLTRKEPSFGKFNIFSVVTILLSVLSGCSLAPGIHIPANQIKKQQVEEFIPPEFLQITPALIRQQSRYTDDHQAGAQVPGYSSNGYQYVIGPNDVLTITVWDHPELATPASEGRSADEVGHLVASDGTIFFPYIGKIPVAGRTLGAVRFELTQKLSDYIKDPQLDVRIASFRSQKINVTGQVKNPGIIPLTDAPLTVLEAVNAAGGNSENADLTRVSLVRGGKTYSLDLYEMLEKGDLSQNHILKNHDIINIPDRLNNKVFVIGEVKNQTSHLMHRGRMTLADAMGQSGGADQRFANAQKILVIRADNNSLKPNVFYLNANDPTALLLSTRFELKPLDVVYVSTSELTRWNRVLSQILPTVQGLYDVDRISNRF